MAGALALVGTIGFAPSAQAAYSNEPVARAWEADGPIRSSVGNGSVLYLGGTFNGGGGIVALNSATGALIWSATTDGDVRAMTLSADGSTLYAGGGFTTVNGLRHRHLVSMNAATGDITPNWRASTGGMVRDLVVLNDTLFVGGHFAKINGAFEKGLGALVASTGQSLPGFTAFVDRNVYGLALTPTSLIAVGNFTIVNGNSSRSSIASFNLSTFGLTSWAPRRLCSGCNSYWDVVVDGTNAYVGTSGPGGNLGAFNLVTGNNPWRYVHADGDVQTLRIGPDGLLYLGGHFGMYVGNPLIDRALVAAVNRSNGSVDPNFHPNFFTLYPGIWTIAFTDGLINLGGYFTGTAAGPNHSNNHVPYYAAFAVV